MKFPFLFTPLRVVAALSLVALGCAPLAIAATGDDWQLPPEKPAFKPAAGVELAQANCLMCHSQDYIDIQPRFTRAQWKGSVTKMQQKFGAPIANETIDPLVDYLVRAYGKPDQ